MSRATVQTRSGMNSITSQRDGATDVKTQYDRASRRLLRQSYSVYLGYGSEPVVYDDATFNRLFRLLAQAGSEPVVHDDATFDRLFRLLAPGQKLPPQVRAVPTHGLRE